MFVLVVLLLHGHVWGSTSLHHLLVCPCFSSSVLHNRHSESEIHDIHEIGSGTKIYYLWVKGYSTWGERETQSFYADCFYIVSSQPNQRAAPVAYKFVWPRQALNLDSLVRRQELNLLLFFKSPKSSAHASGAWLHPHLLVTIPILDFYFDISEWHILSALMLHLTNPCAKRKVLSLTKPKGKIYKTKFLRNYITHIRMVKFLFLAQFPVDHRSYPIVSCCASMMH